MPSGCHPELYTHKNRVSKRKGKVWSLTVYKSQKQTLTLKIYTNSSQIMGCNSSKQAKPQPEIQRQECIDTLKKRFGDRLTEEECAIITEKFHTVYASHVIPQDSYVKEWICTRDHGATTLQDAVEITLTHEQILYWINVANSSNRSSYYIYMQILVEKLASHFKIEDVGVVHAGRDLLKDDVLQGWIDMLRENDAEEERLADFEWTLKRRHAQTLDLKEAISRAKDMDINDVKWWYQQHPEQYEFKFEWFWYLAVKNNTVPRFEVPAESDEEMFFWEEHKHKLDDFYRENIDKVYHGARNVEEAFETIDTLEKEHLLYWYRYTRNTQFPIAAIQKGDMNWELAFEYCEPRALVFLEEMPPTHNAEERWAETGNIAYLVACFAADIVPDNAHEHILTLTQDMEPIDVWCMVQEWWCKEAKAIIKSIFDPEYNNFELIRRVLNQTEDCKVMARVAGTMIRMCIDDPSQNGLLRDLAMGHQFKTVIVDAMNDWSPCPPAYQVLDSE